VRGEFLDLSAAHIYYYAAGTRGSGEPVVLLHGFPTSSHLWSDVVPLMPRGHRIIVLDLLGFGRSGRPLKKALTISAHADRIIEVLDVLGIPKACIVGHDFGGAIAQALAIRYPHRVSRMCLVGSVAFDRGLGREARFARAMHAIFSQLPPEWLLALFRTGLLRGYVNRERGARSIGFYFRPFATSEGRDALLRQLRSVNQGEIAELGNRLGEIVAPTAIVWGRDDPLSPASLATRLQQAIPGSTLEIVSTGHFVPEEAPECLASALSELLSR
jgi:pimeloyl-ACP methyl ester carboxylesterase